MKRIIPVLLVMLIVVSLISPVVIATDSNNVNEEFTLGDIQDMLIEDMNSRGLSLEPGTEEFYEYIVEQLLDHSDMDLLNNKNYALIHAYMAEYKIAYDDYLLCVDELGTNASNHDLTMAIVKSNDCIRYNYNNDICPIEFSLSTEFLSTTISDIIRSNRAQAEAIHSEPMTIAASTYSGAKAAEYALQYAESNNSTFPKYSSDCTNFVSQCLYFGGLDMKGSNTSTGTFDSTTDWYCYYIKTVLFLRKYAVTTSWIRVSDFKEYLSTITKPTTKTSISLLISNSNVGDVVLLADKITGTAYHSIIITEKGHSTVFFSGHTNSRKNADVRDYLDEDSDNFILFNVS